MRQASWGSLHKAKYPTRPKMRANIKLPNSIKDVKIKDEHISGLLSKNNALSEELAALKVEIKASNGIYASSFGIPIDDTNIRPETLNTRLR